MSENESSNTTGMPTRRELLRAITDFVKEFEQRTFQLNAQLVAMQAFLRDDLAILLGDALAESMGEEKASTEAGANMIHDFVQRIQTEIEGKFEAYAVEAMSHERTAHTRERIDLLERLLLNSEDTH